MPKVVVLVPSAQRAEFTVWDAVADGAARVRFTEVEVRAIASDIPADGRRHKLLGGIEELRESDAVIVTTSAAPSDDAELRGVLAKAERDLPHDAFTNTVFAVVGANEPEWLPFVARLGGIVVSAPRGSDDQAERARTVGERVATVVEWVRHARSHEHGHTHQHSHHH